MKILLPKLKFQIVFLLVLLISIMIRKATALLSRRLFRYSRDNRRALYDSGRKLDALKPTVDTVVVEGAYVQLTTGEKRARVRVRVMLGLGSGLVERTIDRARVKVVGISLGNLKVLLLVKVTVE